MKRIVALVLILLVSSFTFAFADGGPVSTPGPLLSFSLTPSFSIPLGDYATYFGYGGGATLCADYRMPFLPLLYAGAGLGYSYFSLQKFSSLSTLTGGCDAGVWYDIIPSLSVRAFALGGYSYSFLNNGLGSGGTPYVGGGADLAWAFVPFLSVSVGASYRYFVDLYSDIAVTLGVSYNLR